MVTLPCRPQSVSPGSIHTVLLLLAEKELVTHRERLPGVQVSLSPPCVPTLFLMGKAESG